ncbi:MAG TPA: ethanolamine ammonia-lyase reactivating factor EutA [Fluviicola sp.]|nr:ethanolamine ammonia-lyase reactivating factor EutA [Fluviicola sp.]
MSKIIGAIDVGSNAARLLIGQVVQEKSHAFIKKISYTRLPLRLGEEVFENGRISDKKKTEFVKTMKAFALIADLFEVDALRACATSAMRDAENNQDVLLAIKHETGIDLEVISGNEEANLIFETFSILQLNHNKPFVVMDVGGGSTEISVFEKGKRTKSKSFEIGTLRLLKGKVEESTWKNLKQWIQTHLSHEEHLIYGTGGNINKIHKLLGVKEKKPISTDKLKKLMNQLCDLSNEERMDKFQLKPDRADVIVPALEVYLNCLNTMKAKEIYVPKVGLSDGIIVDLTHKLS